MHYQWSTFLCMNIHHAMNAHRDYQSIDFFNVCISVCVCDCVSGSVNVWVQVKRSEWFSARKIANKLKLFLKFSFIVSLALILPLSLLMSVFWLPLAPFLFDTIIRSFFFLICRKTFSNRNKLVCTTHTHTHTFTKNSV